MMIGRVQAQIHPDVVNACPITFIRIEENQISDVERREIFDLNTCIRDDDDSRRGITYFKGAAGYRAMGWLGLQTEGHRVIVSITRQVVTITPSHADES